MKTTYLGMRLPHGINVEPERVLVYDDIDTLFAALGTDDIEIGECEITYKAWRTDLYVVREKSLHVDTIQKIRDNQLNSQDDMNLLAQVFLQIDDALVGNYLIFGAVNPDTMEIDGEFHDLPEWVFEMSDAATERAADTWNDVVEGLRTLTAGIEQGVVSQERLMEALDNDDPYKGAAEIGLLLTDAQVALSDIAGLNVDDYIAEIQTLLDGDDN